MIDACRNDSRTQARHPDPVNTFQRPFAPALAWLVAGVTVAMLVVGALMTASRPTDLVHPLEQGRFTEVSPIISVLLGAMIIQRKGNHPIGWLFCCSGLLWGVYHLAAAGSTYVASDQPIAAGSVWLWGTTWPPVVAFGLAPGLVLFVFPSGRLPTPRWRRFVRFAAAGIVAGAVAYSFAPGPLEEFPSLDNPWGVQGVVGSILTALRELAWPLLLVSMFGGVISLRQRMRAGSFEERQQIKWLFLAGAVLVVFVSLWGYEETVGDPNIAPTLTGLVLPLVAVAVAIAILKHRLYDIDVLINRTLVYVVLSAILAAVYLGAVFLLQRVLAPITVDSNIAIAASTLAVAGLFRPLRTQVQQFIDQRFYRQKYDAAETVGQFSQRLRNELDLDALEGELLGVVAATLHPSQAGLWLKTSEAQQ